MAIKQRSWTIKIVAISVLNLLVIRKRVLDILLLTVEREHPFDPFARINLVHQFTEEWK